MGDGWVIGCLFGLRRFPGACAERGERGSTRDVHTALLKRVGISSSDRVPVKFFHSGGPLKYVFDCLCVWVYFNFFVYRHPPQHMAAYLRN